MSISQHEALEFLEVQVPVLEQQISRRFNRGELTEIDDAANHLPVNGGRLEHAMLMRVERLHTLLPDLASSRLDTEG